MHTGFAKYGIRHNGGNECNSDEWMRRLCRSEKQIQVEKFAKNSRHEDDQRIQRCSRFCDQRRINNSWLMTYEAKRARCM